MSKRIKIGEKKECFLGENRGCTQGGKNCLKETYFGPFFSTYISIYIAVYMCVFFSYFIDVSGRNIGGGKRKKKM